MQQEGSKAFESLVKDGTNVQKKTQQATEETLTQAQARVSGFASEFGAKAAGGWGKLENIFEERVARALEKLGVPSAQDMAALHARIEALEAQLMMKASETTPRRTATRKTTVHKTSAAADSAAVVKPSRRSTTAPAKKKTS
jgi:poly(hydroxyalkanoate) granule-associated protein